MPPSGRIKLDGLKNAGTFAYPFRDRPRLHNLREISCTMILAVAEIFCPEAQLRIEEAIRLLAWEGDAIVFKSARPLGDGWFASLFIFTAKA